MDEKNEAGQCGYGITPSMEPHVMWITGCLPYVDVLKPQIV